MVAKVSDSAAIAAVIDFNMVVPFGSNACVGCEPKVRQQSLAKQ
jgi:hypothetical protein